MSNSYAFRLRAHDTNGLQPCSIRPWAARCELKCLALEFPVNNEGLQFRCNSFNGLANTWRHNRSESLCIALQMPGVAAAEDIHSDPFTGALTVCFHDGKDDGICRHMAKESATAVKLKRLM